jgi:hypothetical protein
MRVRRVALDREDVGRGLEPDALGIACPAETVTGEPCPVKNTPARRPNPARTEKMARTRGRRRTGRV